MNRIGKTLLLMTALVAGVTAHAQTADSRYDTIVDRNIFRLTSPPPPPAAPTNTEALDRNIELSGISNIGGKKKAWFIVKAKGAKESQYVNLGENERQEFLEVVSISEEEGEVTVLNSGSSMVLSFKNNAPKATAGGAAPPPPVPIATANVVTQPSYANAAPSGSGSSVTVSGGAPVTSLAQPGQAESGLRTIPTRTLRLQPVAQPQPQESQTPVDPQKQRETMEIQKAVYDAAGIPLPPLPPTTTVTGGKALPTPGGPPSIPGR